MPRNALRVAAALLAVTTATADAPTVTLLFDSEFGGYVAVVGGIERPDLAVRKSDGRAPESPRKALHRARRAARRDEYPRPQGAELLPRGLPAPQARAPSRRWVRREAVTTELLVLDGYGRPVEGARVYRYTDPSFYGVNQDASGARLFDTWRLLPMPFSGRTATDLVTAHEDYWRVLAWAPVRAVTPNIDAEHNPWVRQGVVSTPALELVAVTDGLGGARVVSGIFNLRDERRFPRAVVPDALRLGFVVVADGFQPTTTEKRLTKGGVTESRTLQLLDGPHHELFDSSDWNAAIQLADDVAVSERTPAELDEALRGLLAPLALPAARVREPDRAAALSEAEARLWEQVAAHVPADRQLELARRALAATPENAARRYRVGLLLAIDAGVDLGAPAPKDPQDPPAGLAEAEELLESAVASDPRFLPPYMLLDQLLARRGAADEVRRTLAVRMLKHQPFDRWARARMAVFQLRAGRHVEAFDHLRYTYMAVPGLGGDRELALALSKHYWRVGLPEKAGAYAWLLTGRVPEDPFVRPNFSGS